jgi:hypothetical protein
MNVKHFFVLLSDLSKNIINDELTKIGKNAEDVINISISNDLVFIFYKE